MDVGGGFCWEQNLHCNESKLCEEGANLRSRQIEKLGRCLAWVCSNTENIFCFQERSKFVAVTQFLLLFFLFISAYGSKSFIRETMIDQSCVVKATTLSYNIRDLWWSNERIAVEEYQNQIDFSKKLSRTFTKAGCNVWLACKL